MTTKDLPSVENELRTLLGVGLDQLIAVLVVERPQGLLADVDPVEAAAGRSRGGLVDQRPLRRGTANQASRTPTAVTESVFA